jgi:hypothetical protein
MPVLETVLRRYGKTKIAYLIGPIFIKDIGRLDISMKIPVFVDVIVSSDDLFSDFASFVVGELFPLFQKIVQVSLHELCNNVCVVLGCVDVVQS